MRQLIHRILSGAPMFGLVVLGLVATARPMQTDKAFEYFQKVLIKEQNFWIFLFGIAAYSILWWITAKPSENARNNIKKGIQPHYAATGESISALKRVGSDDAYSSLILLIDAEQQGIADWLSDNMGMPAVRKFLTVSTPSFAYDWPGNPGSQFSQKRGQYIDALSGRLANLQDLMESDSWDPSIVPFARRIRLKLRKLIN